MKRLIDWDAESRTATWHEYDSLTDTTTIADIQDVEPFIDRNKELAKSDAYRRKGMKESWLHAASIPIGVQYKWLQNYGVDIFNKDHLPKVKQLLNSAEWKYLRTTTGRL